VWFVCWFAYTHCDTFWILYWPSVVLLRGIPFLFQPWLSFKEPLLTSTRQLVWVEVTTVTPPLEKSHNWVIRSAYPMPRGLCPQSWFRKESSISWSYWQRASPSAGVPQWGGQKPKLQLPTAFTELTKWQKQPWSQASVAHACNPSYSEAEIRRSQSQPSQIVHKTLSWKNLSQRKGLEEWLMV
jgi:hypothetical protein